MDSTAFNYDPSAVADDGSCLLCYATADIGADKVGEHATSMDELLAGKTEEEKEEITNRLKVVKGEE